MGLGLEPSMYCQPAAFGVYMENEPCFGRALHYSLLSRFLDPLLPPDQRAPTASNTMFWEQYKAAQVGGSADVVRCHSGGRGRRGLRVHRAAAAAASSATLVRRDPLARAPLSCVGAQVVPNRHELLQPVYSIPQQLLPTAAAFQAAAAPFEAQAVLWVGAPPRIADGSSFTPLPEWFAGYAATCPWVQDA